MVRYFGIMKRYISTSVNAAIGNVTVIGAGQMGAGIAQITAQTGHQVTLVDVRKDLLKRSQEKITANLEIFVKKKYKDNQNDGEKFIFDTLSRLSFTTNTNESVENTDLIVEAIIEKIELKHKLFKHLDDIAPEKTIFASNTSSFTISEIASAIKRRDRFGGLHFCYPVPAKKLLEVICVPETSDATYKSMIKWGEKIGKVCISCRDTPGFVVNKLMIPYIVEAMRMVERGDASVSDIDTAVKLSVSHPAGPLEMADFIGLDTVYYILNGWYIKYPECKVFKPPDILVKLLDEGKYGYKNGEGFYKYN